MDGSLTDKVTSTACQDWAVFIVSSLKENEASTMIKNIIAKTEYFIFGRLPNPGCMLNGRPVARGECISSRASGTPVTTSPAGD